MNTNAMIALPRDKLMLVVETAFAMSTPVGLGFLHYQPGSSLPEEERKFFEERSKEEPRYEGQPIIHMDYVQGRQCKMGIFIHPEDNNQILLNNSWYDHSDFQLAELLETVGVENGMNAIQKARANEVS